MRQMWTSAGHEVEKMDKAEANQEVTRIHQEYNDDIGEFWDFARWVAKAQSDAKKLHAELEQQLPGALGSIENNPEKGNRFPYSNKIIIKTLLLTEIIFFEEMIKKYMRLLFRLHPGLLLAKNSDKHSNGDEKGSKNLDYQVILEAGSFDKIVSIMIDKELYRLGRKNIDDIETYFEKKLKVEKFSTVLRKWQGLRQGYFVRNLVVHNNEVMNEETYRKVQVCKIGEVVPLQIDLIYSVADGLTELNDHLLKFFSTKFIKSTARVGQEPCAPDDAEEKKRLSRPQGS